MKATVVCSVVSGLFLGLMASAAETYYLSGSVQMDAEAPVSLALTNSAGAAFSVERTGDGTEGDPWTFDFSALDPAAVSVGLGSFHLYCARAVGSRGTIVLHLAGAEMVGANPLAVDAKWGNIPDHIRIVHAGDMAPSAVWIR